MTEEKKTFSEMKKKWKNHVILCACWNLCDPLLSLFLSPTPLSPSLLSFLFPLPSVPLLVLLQVKIIRDEVLSPLSILLGLFNDPLLLMSKRGDKLLDYDSLQYDLEKCTEPDKLQQLKEDVTLAKRY